MMRELAEDELPVQKIFFSLKQKGSMVSISFAYTSVCLELDEMTAIWEKGSKDKGNWQENNLYQLRRLVKDNDGNIYMRMKTVDDIDYLCMKIDLPCKNR